MNYFCFKPMRARRIRGWVVASFAACVVALAACGSGSSDTDNSIPEPTAEISSETPAEVPVDGSVSTTPPEGARIVALYRFEGSVFVPRAYIALADGTITDDFEGVRENGIDVSRSTNPDRWGDYVEGDDPTRVQLRFGQATDFESIRIRYPEENVAPHGCYSSTTGLAILGAGGATALSTSKLCFNASGYFASQTESGFVTEGQTVGSGEGSDGSFIIVGDEITFTLNDGSVTHSVFATFSPPEGMFPVVSIDGLVLTGNNS